MIMFFCLAASVDHSRVKLKNTENDYINASLIVMEEAERSYILTQASIIFVVVFELIINLVT